MAKNQADKLAAKRAALIDRTALVLGVSAERAAALLRTPRVQSVRLNPLRGNTAATLAELQSAGWQGESFAWAPDCYNITNEPEIVRDSQAATEGRAFIQNAASWLPVLALDPQPGDEILDCARRPAAKRATSRRSRKTKRQLPPTITRARAWQKCVLILSD